MQIHRELTLFTYTNSYFFSGYTLGEADSQSEWADVQKKIIPWGHKALESDLELTLQDRAAKLGKSISRLIVVASLIDKPTNLGGKIIFQVVHLRPDYQPSVAVCVFHTQPSWQASEERLGCYELRDLLETVLVRSHSVQGCAGPVRCSEPQYLWLAVSSVSVTDSSSTSASPQSSGSLW